MFENPDIGFNIEILVGLKVAGKPMANPYLMSRGYDNAHLK